MEIWLGNSCLLITNKKNVRFLLQRKYDILKIALTLATDTNKMLKVSNQLA